jgi:WD40 repeat protein/tetratricopeptide (TPR) repeat protein
MKTTDTQRPNPFPGLRPFRSDEHHLFFGREEQTAALLQLLRTNRFLAVVGTSGSGKSSLVRAGMIAELHGGTMTQAGSAWEVMILRPGGSPIENLARAFVDADLYDPGDANTLPRLLATLNRSRFGLVEAMKQSELFEPGTNLLVVVDQFEELFRFRQQGVDSEETAAAFVNLLLSGSGQAECPIYVTITMRSDYLGDCSEIPGLAEAVNEGEYLIPRLLRDQKRDAIEKPIGVGGAKISPLLVQRLLNEVGDDADQLPVLQHALMRMWDVWSAGSDHKRPIDFDDFEATGGLGAALSNHSDEIYDSLPDDRHRSACEKIFKTLTVKGDDNRGIRRPTRLAQLQAIAGADRDTVTTVLDAFRGSGVTFLMPGTEVELNDRTVLDLSHESLMRGWQRLRGWVEDEAQSARIFRRLLDTARLWSDGKAGLFRDPDLQIALSWRAQEAPNAEWAEQYGGHFEKAIGFLETSNAEAEAERQAREAARQRELAHAQELAESRKQRLVQQQRATRRLRKLIAGLAVVALIAGLACVAALIANRRANKLAEIARQNEDQANQNAQQAEQSRKDTEKALQIVESEKTKALAAEGLARAEEEKGRKLLYTTDMRLAPFVWRDDRTTAEQLRVLLAKHIADSKAAANKDAPAGDAKPDLRGFEWHYYQHLLEHSATVFSGHAAAVAGGAFTSDGQLVTLDQNGQVRRWDLSSQAEIEANRRDLPGGPVAKERVLSPNGRLAALADGKNVHVFAAATGNKSFSIDSTTNRSPFHSLIFSRDGDRLVILDDKLRWCNASTGEVIASIDQKHGRVEALALSADGLTLAVVGYGNLGNQSSIFRLDPTTRKVTPKAKDLGLLGTLSAAALSPDGQRVAVGAKLSGTLAVFDTATGRPIALHGSAHASPISALAFSGDGATLATADAEGTIKIWADVQKMNSKTTALRTLKGHQGAIRALGFSIDGKRLASVSADKTARVWDLENAGAAIRALEGTAKAGSNVARFSPDGQLIAVADASSSSVRLWDAATGRLVRELSVAEAADTSATHKGRVRSVAFSPTDQRLLAVGYGGQANVSHVVLWDTGAGTELARLPGATDLPNFQVNENNGAIDALAFSPDGKFLVAGFGAKNLLMGGSFATPLKVWEVTTRRLIRRLNGHTNYCISLDFSRDGTLLASASRDGTAILWSTKTWKATQTLHNADKDSVFRESGRRGMVEDVAFSPDGKLLAMASREGTVQLWDVAPGKLLATLKGHSSAVEAVVFSPDGRTLVSGGTDQTVRLWNVETRRELMQLDPGGIELGQVMTLALSPDGKQLLAGGRGGTACWSTAPLIWNDPERAAARLRLLLQSNADFQTRIQMLSENLRLHEALAKLDEGQVSSSLTPSPKTRFNVPPDSLRAALAATQANWHASRQAWPETVKAFDRLLAADPPSPLPLSPSVGERGRGEGAEGWLRTPGLLRLATALLHQDRPTAAAVLLQGSAKLRSQDPANARVTGFGIDFDLEEGAIRVKELEPYSPAARSKLLVGDVIVKVDGVETTTLTLPDFQKKFKGEVGTKLRLTVRHPGKTETEDVGLVTEKYRVDAATAELFSALLAALEKRLARNPRDAGLLELRAELAGEESDFARQVPDYTAAIEALSGQKGNAQTAHLKRLYGRRGNAHVALKQWQQAVDDYARAVTDATTDDALLSNQALAQAEVLLSGKPGRAEPDWVVLKPAETKTESGTKLALQDDGSILVQAPPQPEQQTVRWQPGPQPVRAVRIETSTHALAPKDGTPFFNEYQAVAVGMAVSRPGALQGQFVRLDLPGDNSEFPRQPQLKDKKTINLAELQVFHGDQNIAFRKKARQSTNLYPRGRGAENAVDGNTRGDDNGPPYAHTAMESDPWWEVDLGSEQPIDRIVIWNRSEEHLYVRMNHFRIRVLDRSRKVVFEQVVNKAPSPSTEIVPQALLVETKPTAAGENPPLIVRLPRSSGKDALPRYRVSGAAHLADLGPEEKRLAALKLTDPWQKLAAAYELKGDQRAIGQMVERHPKLAGPVGDLFTQEPNQNWQRAVEIYNKGITPQTTDADLLSRRARAYEAAKKWDAAAADWSRAETGNPDGAKQLGEFARRLAAGDQVRLAKAEFEKSQELYERALEADPENDLVAPELAQLLLDKHENEKAGRWTVLKPAIAKSELGATLSVLPDHSILASGANPLNESYRVVLTLGTAIDVTAVRLEALTHPSLPGNGPGRQTTPGVVGGFAQASWKVTAASPDRKDPIPLEFDRAWADHQDRASPINPNGHWNTGGGGGEGQNCTAVWSMSKPVSLPAGTVLTFQMQFGAWRGVGEGLGRFRLSVSGDPVTLAGEEKRFAAMQLTDPLSKLAAAYAVNGRNDEALQYFGRALQRADGYEARKPILEFAARFDDVLSALAQRQPDDRQLQLALGRNLAERGKQRLAEKQPAQAQAELEKSREILTRLRAESPWSVLTATDLKSQGGETLTVEKDGSVFVSGPNPERAVYTLKLRTDLPTLTAIRLETIPDPRLPQGGAGRDGGGNFHLAELTATVVSGAADGKGTPIELASAIVDYDNYGSSPSTIIDGDPESHWNPTRVQEPHWAVFVLKSPARMDGGSLKITLDSGISPWPMLGLGRFRLSATNEADIVRALVRNDLKDSEVVDLSLALAKAHAQQSHVSEAGAAFTEALPAATDRAAKAKIIAEAAPLNGVLEKLTQRAAGDAQFQAELARHYAERGNAPLAEAARTKARTLFEEKLAKEPENSAWAAQLAEVLLIDSPAKWTVLKPTHMKSEGGATLTLLDDNSILASGANPDKDVYVIHAAVQGRIESIRLEAIPHPSLPHGSSGRRLSDGNFALTEFKLEQATDGRQGAFTPVPLRSATCDYSQPHSPIRNVLDRRDDTFWDILPYIHEPHYAVFKPERPLAAPAGLLRFTLEFKTPHKEPLGRVRLSVSSASAVYDQEEKRFAALKFADPWSKLAAAYAVNGRNDEASQYFTRALKQADGYEVRKPILEFAAGFDDVLSALARRQPDDAPLQLALARNLTARGKTALAAAKPAAALVDLKQAQDIITRLLPPVAAWTVLTPVEMQSETGAKMELQKDGSVFVQRPPRNDTYSLTFQTKLKGIKGLRLEALADSRLPGGGPGWDGAGNFVLNELTLEAASADGLNKPRSVGLRNPSADFSQLDWDVRGAVDGNSSTGWAISPQFNKDHVAVFDLAEEVGDGQATRLTVRLHHHFSDVRYLLGRFRLSFTNDAAALQATRIRLDLKVSEVVEFYVAPATALVQQGQIDEAVTVLSKALDLVSNRTPKAQIIAEAAPLKGVLEKLARSAAGDGQFQAELARHYAGQGNARLAASARTKARTLLEEKLAKEPENSAVAADLAEVLLLDTTAWSVLKPVEAKSELGATLSILPDDSILASGANPLNDRYRVVLTVGTDIKLAAVRLEALTHSSLPKNGPGRYPTGNYAQTSWKVTATLPGSKDPIPLDFDKTWADQQFQWGPEPSGHFNIYGGGEGRDCTAIWATSKPASLVAGAKLTFEFQFKSADGNSENLGHFRLSVTGDRATLERQENRVAVGKANDPWLKLAAAYALNGRTDEALPYFSKALQRADGYEARKPIVEAAARFDDVLAALSHRQPDEPQLQLAMARKLTARGKTALAAAKPAAALVDLKQAQDIVTRLLPPVTHWTVLTPVETRTETGAKMELQKDGSVFVQQSLLAKNDTYSLVFQSEFKGITGLRLEVLADSRLPNGGPGWAGGNFVVNELTLEAAPAGSPDKARAIALRNAWADHSQPGWDVTMAVDGNGSTGWALYPEVNKDRTALFELAEPVGDGQAARLTVRLNQQHTNGGVLHSLGRFRLSFTNDRATLPATQVWLALKDSELVDFYGALAKAHTLQGQTKEAVAAFTEALPLAADRAGKAKIIAAAAPLAGVLEKLAERAGGDAQFQAELARYYAERGNVALAEAARTKARTFFEDKLAQQPENSAWAAELAELLLIDSRAKWTILKPTSMKSEGGATLTLLEDGSILAGGESPPTEVYTITTPAGLSNIEAFRLEAIPHASLPQGSSGRRLFDGDFALTEFKIEQATHDRQGAFTPVPLRSATCDYSQPHSPIMNVLDRRDDTFWDILPHVRQPHFAVFKPERPLAPPAGLLRFTLEFKYPGHGALALGRFRLSVSDNAAVLESEQKRFAVMKLADAWQKLAAAYHVIGDQRALDKLLKDHPAATAGIGDLYAAEQDWKRAIAEYDKAITSDSKDASIFAARAEAHEKLEHWELAAADWGNADRYASDKKVRYGNPSRPALEHRALIYAWRLQQFDKEVQDCTELLKPERLGENPWTFNLRGEAYERLRQWDKALADFDQAVKVCQPNERENFQFFRARHFAARGQWRQAADEMRPLYQKTANNEWWRLRDASLIFAIAGDVENYGKAAAECYGKQAAGNLTVEEVRWTVLTMLQYPEMITNENRPRLLEMAGKLDAYWQPRLTAAIHFRSGAYKKAAGFFDANAPGGQFLFLAAMTYEKLGKHDRAKELFAEGNSWIREQRGKDPGTGVPKQYFAWQDWVIEVALQYEASELILGPGVGADKLPERAVGEAQFQAALARHFAARGNAAAANAARAKARALFERQLAAEPDNAALASELADLLWSALPPVEYVWIDDAAPSGANLQGDTPWEWVSGPEYPVFRGKKATRRQAKVLSQHFFDGAAPGLRIGAGAKLFAHVYLDPKDPPKAVMLQFKDGTGWEHWEHRAFWGEDVIAYGAGGKESHLAMGPLPRAGEWVRLEVEAARVGLSAGAVLDGWAFTQHGGTCYWDAAGYTGSFETPWQKLAAVYHRLGDQQALDTLVKQHPEAASGVGDLYAAAQDWERAIAEYRKLVTDQPADVALLTKLAKAYQPAGRTREAVPYLTKASAANPKDTLLSLQVASLQAWFGQEKELAATRQRILAVAEDTSNADLANTAARICSLTPSTGKAELEAALALGHLAVKLHRNEWTLLSPGMAEYRSGNYAAADEALLDAANANPNNPHVVGTAAFYRAMSLFRQGKKAEARKVAIGAAAQMKPLPKDEQNPLVNGAYWDDLILWLAYKEVRTLLKIDQSPIEILEEARKDEVKTLGADHPTTVATTLKLADAYVAGGRTRESVPLLASASAANPKDTALSIKVAALQAWFGQEKELAATRQRILAFAKGTNDAGVADYAAKSCSILPSTDKAELEAALALGRTAAMLDNGSEWRDWRQLARGMAEYRSGNDTAAAEALRAAAEAGLNPRVAGIAAFYRAMILFRQGKPDEARKLATLAAAKMKPLPADEQNPLTGGAYYDDLILWLAHKEAKAMIKFDAAPPTGKNDKK